MHEREGIVFGASTDMEGRNHFTDGVESQPEPGSGRRRADAGVEFVHLHERKHEVAKEEVVPILTMMTHPLKPTSDGCIRVTRKANEHGHVHAFRQKPEHEFDLLGVSFQVVERGVDATGEDFGAGLALEALNLVVRTIPDEGMKVSSGTPQYAH